MTKPNFMKWNDPQEALITGASSGIGAEFARQLASQGFNLVLVARRKKKLDEIAKELESTNGIHVTAITADLSNIDGIDRIANGIEGMNTLDVLINNAGFGPVGDFIDLDFKDAVGMMRVHMDAPVRLCRAALPGMKQRGRGVIINVASGAAFLPSAGGVMYGSTKVFLVHFTEAIALEFAGTGIIIQALCPGFTHTEFHDHGELPAYKNSIPKFMWSTAAKVVAESFAAFKKKKIVLLSGLRNRFLIHLVPRSLIVAGSKKSREKLNKGKKIAV
ncbi:MAG TPA: SDR family oxidoreductase [Candidatus Lokiarchaeia archaeon]|nr:SDR family oxidoreductase [Candidatus Lokiarchaeia archaeon]